MDTDFLPLNLLQMPPSGCQIEQRLLGALLLLDSPPSCVAPLGPHHFADPLHGEIYATLVARWALAPEAREAEQDWLAMLGSRLEEIGGAPYLSQAAKRALPAADIEPAANAIIGTWMCRQTIDLAEQIRRLGQNAEIAAYRAGGGFAGVAGRFEAQGIAALLSASLRDLAARVELMAQSHRGDGNDAD